MKKNRKRNSSQRGRAPARPHPLNPVIPYDLARRFLWLPDYVRSMGIHLMAGRGAGKSRLLGRIIAWLDFVRGVPLVIIDPIGGCIDNLLDRIVRLPGSVQESLWERIIYVDFSGSEGFVTPFPIYYRMGTESLYTVSHRYIELIRRLNPELDAAPLLGLNAIIQLAIPAGMILSALGFQITEAEDLIRSPEGWSPHFDRAVRANVEAASAIPFFSEFAQLREAERKRQSTSLLTKIAQFNYDPAIKALVGASLPGIDWDTVVEKRLAVLLDFRGVWNLELRRFLMLHVFNYLMDYIKLRGPGRHTPLSVIIDEVTQVLTASSGNSPLLADDLDALVNVYARNAMIWLTLCHQHNWQLSPRIQKSLMSLGTQIIGVSQDPEEALALARQLFRYDAYKVKKYEPIYTSYMGDSWVIDQRSVFFTPEEQAILKSFEIQDQERFHFLVKPAVAEGDVTGKVHRISIERLDQGLYVNEELVAKARAILTRRSGIPIETILAEIEARLERPQITLSPRALPDDTIGSDADDGHDDLSPPNADDSGGAITYYDET